MMLTFRNAQKKNGAQATNENLTDILISFLPLTETNFTSVKIATVEKNSQYLLARPTVRYQVVEEYRKDYPVSVLRETLGVSLSGYYAWKKRPMSEHQREDQQLAEYIEEVYHSCRQVYGSPRIHAELRDQGITISRKRVARLMREQGLSACRRCHRTITRQ